MTERFNVASYLPATASRRPDQQAIIAADGKGGWDRITFAELDGRTDAIAHGLLAHGIGRGVKTLVMVRAGVELMSLTYGLFKAGAVPVLIDPGMGRKAFLGCISQNQPEAFIGISLAHLARLLFPAPFRTITRHVTVGSRWLWGGPTLEELVAAAPPERFAIADTHRDETAAVLFTSGSTGPAKGAVYSHGNFGAQVDALRATYAFEPGEIDLAAFPLFSLFDCALEMTSVIPEIDPSRPASCDPAKIVGALKEHHCTTAFGSPSIWKKVAPWALEKGEKLPELKRVLMAGAPVPPTQLEPLRKLLEADAEAFTPYGATEALPVANVGAGEIMEETAEATRGGAGTCVGRPTHGIELAIIRISDDPIDTWSDHLRLPRGEVGEICVKGPVVTRSYHRRSAATRIAKIREGEAIWHRMGDLGSLDRRGRVWFAGRKAERVLTTDGPLFTDPVEGRYLGRPGVSRCALVGVGERGSEMPVLVIESETNASLAKTIVEEGHVKHVLFHKSFPVDVRHNAKIHRHTLKRWAEKQLGWKH